MFLPSLFSVTLLFFTLSKHVVPHLKDNLKENLWLLISLNFFVYDTDISDVNKYTDSINSHTIWKKLAAK